MPPEEDQGVERIARAIVDTSNRLLQMSLPGGDLPPCLYHFTDAKGVIGIIESQSLWASRARCLNDAAEVRYGINLAREYLDRLLLKAREGTIPHRFRSAARQCLEPSRIVPRYRVDVDPFIVAFCPSESDSSHWIHYGRSGDGYALGFRTEELRAGKADLIRVVYDPEEQHRLLAFLQEGMERVITELASAVVLRQGLVAAESAGYMLAQMISASAAWVKHPAFASEKEWRLVVMDLRGPMISESAAIGSTMRFRPSSNSVVPYYPIDYEKDKNQGLPLESIAVGSRVPFDSALGSLRHLLRSTGYDERVSIGRSGVPLR